MISMLQWQPAEDTPPDRNDREYVAQYNPPNLPSNEWKDVPHATGASVEEAQRLCEAWVWSRWGDLIGDGEVPARVPVRYRVAMRRVTETAISTTEVPRGRAE